MWNTGTIWTPASKVASGSDERLILPERRRFDRFMNALIDRVAAFIETRGLAPPGGRVVVAVSGGLDSMALLRVLSELAPALDWELVVAHYNHRLRGSESDGDERFVREAAGALGLEFRSGRAKAGELRAARKKSVEMACREARHAFLAEIARAAGASRIALAHHADDQAELFLLRLVRGAGQGLAGMSPEDPSPIDSGVSLVRPFLECSRAELVEFVEREGIRFREDSSNASREHERNRVRREVIPFLNETFERKVASALRKSQQIVADESDCVAELALRWLKSGRRANFDNLHPAVQRQCLRLQLIELGFEVSFDLVEQLRERPAVWISVSTLETVSRTSEGVVRRRGQGIASFSKAEREIALDGGSGVFEFSGRTVSWKREVSAKGAKRARKRRDREVFDADKVGRKTTLRHWRPGDRFQPIGMPAPVKLQDWFVNQKIPRDQRRKLLVAVAENGDIFWVEGLRIGERFKVVDATRRRLFWTWKSAAKPG